MKNSTKTILLHNEKLIKTIPANTSVIQKPQKLQSVKNKTFTVYKCRTVVSLIRANWRGYSWRQLELSPDFQSLPTQNIYIEKLAGRDWKKEELREISNYSMISKTVAHTLIYSILFPQQSKVRLFIPFEMAMILLFHSVDFL